MQVPGTVFVLSRQKSAESIGPLCEAQMELDPLQILPESTQEASRLDAAQARPSHCDKARQVLGGPVFLAVSLPPNLSANSNAAENPLQSRGASPEKCPYT